MYLKRFLSFSAFALALSGAAAHADTSFLFTLDNGNYPSISSTIPDSFFFDSATGYYETSGVVVQQVGYSTMRGLLLFNTNALDFASKDADISTTEAIFDGASFLDGTYAALLSNDFPQQLSGIPEGPAIAGTLVISTVTPEPSSFLLLGTGLLGTVAMARRRWSGAAGV